MAYYNDFKKYGCRPAVISDNGEILRYDELEQICISMGENLDRCLVFSFCENSIGSFCGYIACLYNGIVPLLLKEDIEAELRTSLIKIYEPAYLYIPKRMEKDFDELECVFETHDYRLLRTRYTMNNRLHPELALLLTTSGSTGSPKLVRQSYKNIQVNAESIATYLELDCTERPITTLPMNYTYGLSILNSHLLVGATILMTNKTMMEKDFWKFFKDQKATSFGGVPYTYEMLRKLRFFNMDLPSLRTMTQAGGKLSKELHKEFAEYAREKGKRFFVMYGQTEATARMAYLPYERAVEKYGSMGFAIPGGKLWLKDIEGNEINKPEEVGELIYEGPNVTLGYAVCAQDLIKEDERHGILETGDMAKRDRDGFFYIVGRKKRFLKLFGNRVNLDECEQMIKGAFDDLECACTGVDDKMYVFVTDASEQKQNLIKSYISGKTGIHPSAFCIKSISQIPKNEAGKTLYIRLEEYYD